MYAAVQAVSFEVGMVERASGCNMCLNFCLFVCAIEGLEYVTGMLALLAGGIR